jgi:diguanylate cyclase (GGDEF)-like protein
VKQTETLCERDILRKLQESLHQVAQSSACDVADSTLAALSRFGAFLAQREAELIKQQAVPESPDPDRRQGAPVGPHAGANPPAERRNPTRSSLAHIPLLSGVSAPVLDTLLSRCRFRDLATGEILLRAGSANDRLYVIMSGSVGVHLDIDERPYVTLASTECVGEMSILGDMNVTANIIAGEQCRLMEIDRDLVWDLIRPSSEFARNLLYTLAHRVGRSMRRQRESAREASRDPLTGLHNRRSFSELFLLKRDSCNREAAPFSLMMIDIDLFKKFNDTHGHLVGDVALCAVANTLAQGISEGITGRYGGEEFVALLPGMDISAACTLANTICDQVRALKLHDSAGEELPPVTISIGVASAAPGDDLETLIRAADIALYRAKKQGRNRVVAEEMGTSPASG